MELYA